MLHRIRRLWDHIQWADQRIFDAIQADATEAGAAQADDAQDGPTDPASDPQRQSAAQQRSAAQDAVEIPGLADASNYTDVRREFAHIIGSEENWLARLEHRTPRAPVWPEVSLSELKELFESVHRSYGAYLAELTEAELSDSITYTNSSGNEYTNEVGDILMHVALHGQYHRGKINLLLRLSGRSPAPADYIAYVRGAPAATTG